MDNLGTRSTSKNWLHKNTIGFPVPQKMTYTSTMLFLFIICLLIRAAQDYISIARCLSEDKEWQVKAERKTCQEPTLYLLVCAIIKKSCQAITAKYVLNPNCMIKVFIKLFIYLKKCMFKNDDKITFLFAFKLILGQHSL